MGNKTKAPVQKNRIATLARGAVIVNIISWGLLALPNFLQSFWSVFMVVTIPLSAVIALLAGVLGERQAKIFGTGLRQSQAGTIVGVLNILAIGVALIGIYAMVNLP